MHCECERACSGVCRSRRVCAGSDASVRQCLPASRVGSRPQAMRFRTTFAFVLMCALCASRPAHAGPVEQMVQVALHPTDPKVMTIRYTWGGDGMLRTTD